MQVTKDKTKEQAERIRLLEQQVEELTSANLVLKEQLARKEQFTAMIAHELRGPLAPIINYAQMLARSKSKKPEVVKRQTSIIISQARRLTRLVNDLLDTSRLNAGQFSLSRQECDIVALTNEIVDQMRPLSPYHTINVVVPTTPIKGHWDDGRIQQAIGNLLDNAVKYSDENTVVTVMVSKLAHTVRISVHNQGSTIPSNDVGQLFRPYSRLQATSNRQGSGLGLYITKSIIEAHGGLLRLEPGGTGEQGTMFSFELPLS